MADPRAPHGPEAPPDAPGKKQAPTGGVGPGSGAGMGGRGAPRPGLPGGTQSPEVAKVYTIPPWFQVRPPTAREIRVEAWPAVAFTAATTPLVIPGSVLRLPEARTGVLKSLGLQINTLLLTSQVTWTLLVDNSAVQGWTDIALFPTPAAFFGKNYGPGETTIFIPEASTISVSVNVTDAGAYLMGVDYHGWHVAMKLAALQEQLYKV